MSPGSLDELVDDGGPKPADHGPCALCEQRPGRWLVFGGRWFCSWCCEAWKDSGTVCEPITGEWKPVFERWFAEQKARAA